MSAADEPIPVPFHEDAVADTQHTEHGDAEKDPGEHGRSLR